MRRKKRKKFKQFNFCVDSKLSRWGGLIFCCFILLFGLGYAVYASGVFKITEADIKSNIPLGRSLRERIKGKSLFELDINSISSTILKAHPEYKKVYVFRVFPSLLKIEVVKRIPFAQIKERRFYPVDAQAIILSEGSSQLLDNLIPIEISNNSRSLKKGRSIKSRRLEYAFDLIEAMDKEDFGKGQVTLINASNPEAIEFIFIPKFSDVKSAFPAGGIRVKVGKGDFKRKLKLFKDLMDYELKDKISLLEYIDLRFKKPYYQPKR